MTSDSFEKSIGLKQLDPYLKNNKWVFIDYLGKTRSLSPPEYTKLSLEPHQKDINELINDYFEKENLKQIKKFSLFYDTKEFVTAKYIIKYKESKLNGCVFSLEEIEKNNYLCDVWMCDLFYKYFKSPPPMFFFSVVV